MKLTALFLPILLCLAPLPALAHSAVESISREGEPGWKERHVLINRRAAEMGKKAQILFIGDSITHGWESEGKDVWARYYAPRGALNLGIGADRTQNVLWRLDNGNIAGLAPKVAVLMIGTNNIDWGGNSVGQVADGVRAIVAKLRHDLPATKVLLLAVFPRSENPDAVRGNVYQLNQLIRRVADGRMVHWADIGDRFVQDDGTIPARLMPDMLHLSPEGYAIWADAIEGQVAELLEEKGKR